MKRDFYMDDFIHGEDTVPAAIQIRREMEELLSRGGFHLRKWCSNFPEVLEGVPSKNLERQSSQVFDSGDLIKALRILWDPATDLSLSRFPRMNQLRREKFCPALRSYTTL